MEERVQSAAEEQVFGRYRLLEKIAAGGMGEIHLARLDGAGGFEKLLVIKRLLPELVASEEFRAMFVNEARIAAQLSHANICDIYELGQVDHQYFLAMQYLQGVSLSQIARAKRPVDRDHVRLVAGLIEQACAGLHHAHELKDASGQSYRVVHRDVSPSNLLATFDGVVKVLDFGIATMHGVPRMTSKGSIRGKFAYMSPEQISGQELDRASDIFSLGIVMFEALTRTRLFQRPSEFLVAKAILEDDYPDAHDAAQAVPPELAHVVARAMARKPGERYPTAHAMAEAIRAAMSSFGGAMTPSEIGARLRADFADELATQQGQYDHATSQVAQIDGGTESLGGPPPLARAPSVADGTAPTRALRPVDRAAATTVDAMPAAAPTRRLVPAVLAALVGVATAVVAFVVLRGGGSPAAAPADAAPAMARAAAPIDASVLAPVDAALDMAVAEPPPVDAAAAPEPRKPTTRRASKPRKPQPPPPPAVVDTGPPGRLNLDSDPYAVIFIDGARIDTTPIANLELSPGRHKVRAVLEDGRSQTFTITIRSGKLTTKNLNRW